MKKGWIVGLSVLLLTCGCQPKTPIETMPVSQHVQEETTTATQQQESEPSQIVPLEETLYEMLAQVSPDQNLMLSPYSLEMVMTMLYHCTEGEARAELAEFLVLSGTEDEVYETNKASRKQLLREREGIKLLLGDSFWVSNPQMRQTKELEEALKEHYGCEIFGVEQFTPKVVEDMNQWVSDKTEGMIPKMFDSLNGDTSLVLLNTLFFNGKWQTAFDPKNSVSREFWGYEAEKTTVNYMRLLYQSFAYAHLGGVRAIELPYGKSGEIVMDVFIADGGALDYQALFQYNAAQMKAILLALDDADKQGFGEIDLPKWKESYDINGLEKVFAQAGLEKIYQEGSMPKISEKSAVSQILQKTAIDVTEEGTKAVAASGVVAAESSGVDPEFVFIVDHNFAYVIRDRVTGDILFAGVVNQLGQD